MHIAYPHLFQSITIGKTKLPNRLIMGSMHTGLEARFKNRHRLAAFYRERARGGVGLIITGGISPSRTGLLMFGDAKITNYLDVLHYRPCVDAVHEEGGKIVLQLLHAGRYSYTPFKLSPDGKRSPIQPFKPIKPANGMIHHVIRCFGKAAKLARLAGFDGVEIMGGEGYFINQFLCPHSNDRHDQWGGSTRNRQRFALEVVAAIRREVPDDFMVIFRQSLADFVPQGETWREIAQLAKQLEQLGVDAISTDIGWHESRVPTIITSVPRAAFVHFTERLREQVSIPLIAANRINTPELAETILARGLVDAVSLARPLLCDPEFVLKARENRADEINTCIACNQACLDHVFVGKKVSCLLNPRAGRETELRLTPSAQPKDVVVVGAGPAGLSAAIAAAKKKHRVTIYEKADSIGGQFALAAKIPGKEEFNEALRYFKRQLEILPINVRLNAQVSAEQLKKMGAQVVILASGVRPRRPKIHGIDNDRVLTYDQVLNKQKSIGKKVAILGAGGIGFDMAEFLSTTQSATLHLSQWEKEWGVSREEDIPGSLVQPQPETATREIYMLQRKPGKQGKTLGKTTGWVHRASVKGKGIKQFSGVRYQFIDEAGLHVSIIDNASSNKLRSNKPAIEKKICLSVDNIVLCTGQESVAELRAPLEELGIKVYVVGGALRAQEIDAKRAIREAVEAADAIE